jgi:hypothetical protein
MDSKTSANVPHRKQLTEAGALTKSPRKATRSTPEKTQDQPLRFQVSITGRPARLWRHWVGLNEYAPETAMRAGITCSVEGDFANDGYNVSQEAIKRHVHVSLVKEEDPLNISGNPVTLSEKERQEIAETSKTLGIPPSEMIHFCLGIVAKHVREHGEITIRASQDWTRSALKAEVAA